MKKNKIKPLKDLRLLDRFLFAELMEDEECSKEVLEIILGKDISLLSKEQTEKEIRTATLDTQLAYSEADFVVIAAPTNYDSSTQHFDTSAVEDVIELVMQYNPNVIMVIKSTIPVGYTRSIREKTGSKNIIFSPEFLRESKALYDNGYPQELVG